MSTSLLQLYIRHTHTARDESELAQKFSLGCLVTFLHFLSILSKVTVSKIKPLTYQLFLQTVGLPKCIRVFNNVVSILKGSAFNYLIEALDSTHSTIRSHDLVENLRWRLEDCSVCGHGLSCACVCVCLCASVCSWINIQVAIITIIK